MPLTTITTSNIDTTNSLFFRNRIINGDMRIDQRNAGALINPAVNNTYTVDRWNTGVVQASTYKIQQNAGSVTPPAGFTNYLGATSLTTSSLAATDNLNIRQRIEGFNIADLAWGTASAKPITVSFWVQSSLTGTFSGAVTNAGLSMSYPFTYSIPVLNTWTYITVTIPGATSGTWASDNSTGMYLFFSMGAGTTLSGTAGSWSANDYRSATGSVSILSSTGATFYITGVQLEVGTAATAFERRPYGTELELCQRYFQSVATTADIAYGSSGTAPMRLTAVNNGGTNPLTGWQFPVAMRAAPSIQTYGGTVAGGAFNVYDSGGGSSSNTILSSTDIGFKGIRLNLTGRANSAYQYWVDCGTGGNQLGWTLSAEL